MFPRWCRATPEEVAESFSSVRGKRRDALAGMTRDSIPREKYLCVCFFTDSEVNNFLLVIHTDANSENHVSQCVYSISLVAYNFSLTSCLWVFFFFFRFLEDDIHTEKHDWFRNGYHYTSATNSNEFFTCDMLFLLPTGTHGGGKCCSCSLTYSCNQKREIFTSPSIDRYSPSFHVISE